MARKYTKGHSNELTEREQEVYNLIVNEGLGVKGVSSRLRLSTGTIGKYFMNIYGKYGVNSIQELIIQHYKRMVKNEIQLDTPSY